MLNASIKPFKLSTKAYRIGLLQVINSDQYKEKACGECRDASRIFGT